VKVREDAKLSALYPEGAPGRVTIKTTSGETHTKEFIYPKGHAKSAMSDGDVEAKFRDMVQGRLDSARADALLEAVWNLDRVGDVREVLKLLTADERR
jgi:2-methylcitrate dehydratase